MRTIAIVVLALVLVGPAATAAWPMENADAQNSGHEPADAPDGLGGSRAFDMDGRVLAQVTEGPAGLAIAGDATGTVTAFDAGGRAVWTLKAPGSMRTAPAWTGEHVVLVPRADQALALTPDGRAAWTVDIGNDRQQANGQNIVFVRLASPAVTDDGDVVIGDLEATVQRVDSTGTVVWSHDFAGQLAIEATPAITEDGDVIVAAFVPGTEGRGLLARLDGATGDVLWREQIGSQVVGAPAVQGDRLFVPLRDGDAVQARDAGDGSLVWETGFDDHVTVSPTLHDGLAIAGDIRGILRGLDVSDGSVAWTFSPLQNDPNPDHFSQPGTVLTIADSVAVDAEGRAWVAYWNADMSTCCPPTESGDSPVYLLDAQTGERLDRARFSQALHGPALHGTGVWAGSDDGTVRHWSLGKTIALETFRDGRDVTLALNTDERGSWTIDWGQGDPASGDGAPPAFSTRSLESGTHEIHVQVGDGASSIAVEIPEDADETDTDDQRSGDGDGTDDTNASGDGQAGNDSPPDGDGNEDRSVPGPGAWLVLLPVGLAGLATAGRRQRGR